MTKKEMRKAAKGCGFGKLIKEAERFIEIVDDFRKGKKADKHNTLLTVEQQLKDIEAAADSLRTSSLAAVTVYQTTPLTKPTNKNKK